MKLVVNGTQTETHATTIQSLIDELGIANKIMAAAVNMNVVKQEQWSTFTLNENDKVEFLQFVGGGC